MSFRWRGDLSVGLGPQKITSLKGRDSARHEQRSAPGRWVSGVSGAQGRCAPDRWVSGVSPATLCHTNA